MTIAAFADVADQSSVALRGAPTVRILVLGPFRATRDAVVVPLSACERSTLSALLAIPGTYRTVDDLGHAQSLQSKLGAAAVVADDGLFACAPDQVSADSWDFEHFIRTGQARLDADDPIGAEHAFTSGLDLWRGPPLVELSSRDATALPARFRELRDRAGTGLAEARLQGGRPADAVADLEALVVEEPLHERRWWLLMLALYRCGRRAEALATFGRARRALIDAAGIEPGPDLHALEERIRIDDLSLADLGDGVDTEPRSRHSRAQGHAESAMLTDRERQVALLAGRGCTNKQIARRLGTSPRTIGNQLQAVYNKLGIHDRRDLADVAGGPSHLT